MRMTTTKLNIPACVCGILTLASLMTTRAQSTWNYFISDAGGGNSLLTWSVAGDLATPPGAALITPVSSIAISVDAPGIFADAYVATGTPQAIPTPDGSYLQLNNSSVFASFVSYEANNASGSNNDSFGLGTIPHSGFAGVQYLYNPGTQSALIPLAYSNFNPGTYQSQKSGFSAPITVNLTVGPVPEPSTVALSAVTGLCGLALRRPKIPRSYPIRNSQIPLS